MNEVSLKPVIDELETLFSKFNKAFFEGKLEKPVITVSPDHTRGAYGWCTAWKAWQDGTKEGGYYEINLCAEYLNRPFEETCGTLLHEMVHLQNLQDNVQDTSRSGSYHNRKFKETAEAHGLTVEKGEKYVPTKDKQCLEKFKGRKRLNRLEDVQDLDEYAGILGEETILIDVDDAETSDLLFQIVQDLGLKCRVYKTTRGKHFYFRNPEGYVEKSWTKQTLALGIETDAKVGRNNSYAIMRFNGVDREVLLDCPEDDIQDLPKWLTPVKTSMKFLDMRAGDGRNQALFNYILTLQSEDFTKEEARETIRMINRYTPEIVITNKIPWPYNPAAHNDLLDYTLNRLACNDPEVRALLEEMVGYCL